MSNRAPSTPSRREDGVDRAMDAQRTIGGPQVYALPDAPSDWGATTAARPSLSDAVDPARPVGELDNADALGVAGDRQQVEAAAQTAGAGDDLAGRNTVAGETLPLQRTGAADVRGHRYAERDPGRGRALPGAAGKKG